MVVGEEVRMTFVGKRRHVRLSQWMGAARNSSLGNGVQYWNPLCQFRRKKCITLYIQPHFVGCIGIGIETRLNIDITKEGIQTLNEFKNTAITELIWSLHAKVNVFYLLYCSLSLRT